MSASTGHGRVAVVLLNYLAAAVPDTLSCIESLLAPGAVTPSIILVDNGAPKEATDRILEHYPQVHVIRTGENFGFTGGNNRGIEWALTRGFEYIWILNNDTVVEPNCLERLLEPFRGDDRVGAVGGLILYHADPDRVWFGGGQLDLVRAVGTHEWEGAPQAAVERGAPRETGFLTGCCILASSEAIRAVGGFEEDFFAYVEDVDFCLRLRRAGFRVMFQPAARLYHKVEREGAHPPPHKIVLRDRNRRRLARRRYSRLARLRFALFFYPSRAALAARFLVQGDVERAGAILRGAWER